jgi:hypothetical protein
LFFLKGLFQLRFTGAKAKRKNTQQKKGFFPS